MRSKFAVKMIGAVIFVALLAFAGHLFTIRSAQASPTALSRTYANAAWGFALKMPADFSAYPPNASPNRDASGAPTGQAIVLANTTGAAMQISITPNRHVRSSNTLTAADAEELAPYLDLSEAEPIQIAPGVTGVTFTGAKNPAIGTSTDEVWFAYRGNLYQVSADTNMDELLRSMMATWTFI